MPTYKVTYFDCRGLGEPIRMMLSYLGKEFQDVRIPFEDWEKHKMSMPYGKIPTLDIDGQVYTQSNAICRYLARETRLRGDNSLEDLEIDIIADTFADFRECITHYYFEQNEEEKERKKQQLVKDHIPFYFGKFEQIVKENKYLANRKLSWIDIFVASYMQTIEGLMNQDVFTAMPSLIDLRDEIFKIPQIKVWVDRRPNTWL